MSWLYLILAICAEVAGTTCMKLSRGFTIVLPSLLLFLFYGISFSMLTLALRRFDVSTTYAIWSGLGTVLVALIGTFYFHEPVGLLKVVSIAMIIAGVAGLHLSGLSH